LVGSARAGTFAGKPWADLVFSIAQFPYHDSAWSGPLLVLVDDETWSAAEEFAAVLQDNGAAVIIEAAQAVPAAVMLTAGHPPS
jgi:hypothetical protein